MGKTTACGSHPMCFLRLIKRFCHDLRLNDCPVNSCSWHRFTNGYN
jgi:hypothetical protein